MMPTITVREVLKPVVITTKILGIYPYKWKNQRLVYSKMRLIYIFLCFTLSITATIFYFGQDKRSRTGMFKIITFTIILRAFAWIFTMILALLLLFFRFSKLFEVIASVMRVDSRLNSLGQENRIYRIGLQHRKILVFLVIFEQLVLIFLVEVHTAWIRSFSLKTYVGAFIYPRMVCTTMYLIFVGFTMIIQKRFEIINELLDSSIKTFSKSSICELIYLHKILCSTSRHLNSIFSLQLLMWFGTCFLLILWDLHAATYALLVEQKQWTIALIAAKNIFRNVFDLVYLSKRCIELCYEVIQLIPLNVLQLQF